MLQELDFPLEVKAVDDDGGIEGLAAGYGDVDLGGDVIMPGAMTKSIVGRGSVPMLLYHDQKRPVGAWTSLTEGPSGLHAKGRFSMSTRSGKEAHGLARDGALGGLSIGYSTVRHDFQGKTRRLHELKLHEISLVTVPMHERARVTGVKDALAAGELPTLEEFEAFLREAGGFSRTQAKAVAGHGLKHLLTRREAGGEVDDPAAFLRALLPAAA